MSGKKRGAGGFSPVPPTMLTIAEIEQLGTIFKHLMEDPRGSMTTDETDDIKAIRLLNRQLEELQSVRALNWRDPKFRVWHDATMSALQRFLAPGSPHLIRFRDLRFSGSAVVRTAWGGRPPDPDYVSPQDHAQFQKSCQTSDESLRAVIREIEDLGIYVEQAKPVTPARGRGMSQTFHGPVTIQNQAIATDNAIQRIGQMGDMGVSLQEIARLFQESMDLTRRQVQEGLAGIEGLASEVDKPEDRRNWKSVLESGEKVLGIAGKATDLVSKLAPYTPHILTLVEQAKHWLK